MSPKIGSANQALLAKMGGGVPMFGMGMPGAGRPGPRVVEHDVSRGTWWCVCFTSSGFRQQVFQELGVVLLRIDEWVIQNS